VGPGGAILSGMSVSSVRAVTIGVSDLDHRVRQFESGCGLSVVASGRLDPTTSNRLFDLHAAPRVVVLGSAGASGSPQLRLVEVEARGTSREPEVSSPGPLGISVTFPAVPELRARLTDMGIQFLAPPPHLPFATWGRSADGDLMGLVEGGGAPRETGGPGDLSPVFVVTNLEASLHFIREVLEHEAAPAELPAQSPAAGTLVAVHATKPGISSSGLLFLQFESRPQPMAQSPGLTRGLCRLRFDTTDLHATLAKVPGGGGSLVRGPAGLDDPVLGPGLVALVRAPFGVVVELWQRDGASS